MTTSSDDLNTFLSNSSVPYDSETELIRINDMSRGGLPYYDPDEFNEQYLNYIADRVKAGNLKTEESNHMQCLMTPNALYLDGDWYFADTVDESTYSEKASELATLYMRKWVAELNTKCVCFVFIPDSFKFRKGGFHVLIFTEKNIGQSARIAIYNKIKDDFTEEVIDGYDEIVEVKTSDGFVPVDADNYDVLFDIGPTRTMTTLLPFAEKWKATRRYVLDLKHSSECISNGTIPFFLNGVLYPEESDATDDDVGFKTFDAELETKLEAECAQMINKQYGNELRTFGHMYGKHFAEFIRSLIYLSPNHRFWKMLVNHMDRLRYVFKPFLQIAALSYFIENDGELPIRKNLVLASAKLFHPLLKTAARKVSTEKFEKYSLQYVVDQMDVAYEKFAHIQDNFTTDESNIYKSHELKISKRRRSKDEDSDDDDDGDGIKELGKKLAELKSKIKQLNKDKNSSIQSAKKKTEVAIAEICSDMRNLNSPSYTDEDIRNAITEKNSKLRAIQTEPDKASKEEAIENEFMRFREKYINERVSELRSDIEDKRNKLEATQKEIADKFDGEIGATNGEIEQVKATLSELKTVAKNRKENDDKRLYKSLQERMATCISDWIVFVIKCIMENLTDEIKPFRTRCVSNPYGYVEDGLGNREEISIEELRPQDESNPASISFYHEVLRTWARHFLYATFYEGRSSDDANCLTMTHLVKDFIFINTDDGNNEALIYNFQQTEELANYPYQQWILDKGESDKKLIGTRTTLWIKDLYNKVIKPELTSSNFRKGLKELIDLVQKCKNFVGNLYTDKELAPIANFDKDITKICNNLAAYVQTAYIRKPVEITVDDNHTTFGRNGRIWFDNDGQVHYELKDNHAVYGTGYCNVIFDENYDTNNDNFRLVKRIFETTFPDDDIRIYMERLIASVFVGGLHDVFAIMYGTGGEGKSIFCNMILSMLGSECIGRKSLKETRRGNKSKVINPHGLGGSMKSSVLLINNNEGHDEDGLIHAKDKRFVIMQEPRKERDRCMIHTDIIKEMTSGTETNARRIRGEQQSFIINMLPILQTNVQPSFDTDDAAVHRRVAFIPMSAKFYTDVNKERAKLKHAAKADPSLPSKIEKDIYMAQAVFYYLLPRISEIIVNKWMPSSGIPRPQLIRKATDDLFRNSDGISGWLGQHLVEDLHSCVPIEEIINRITKYNDVCAKSGTTILSKDKQKRPLEVVTQIVNKYEAKVYKYRDEFCTRLGEPTDGLLDKIRIECEDNTAEYAQEKYMDANPIREPADSRRTRRYRVRYNDLILVGYRYEQDEDEENDDDDYDD